MVIKQTVANGIIEAIADLRTGSELEDFTVIVDGTKVGCHRFILGACSQFFRGLLRSGMRESHEHSMTLTSVSHSTFTEILSALYTGIDVLTSENVINIWQAASYLQIGFLVKECENFVTDNLSEKTYEEVYRHAKILDSRHVLKGVLNFMKTNFDVFRNSPLLRELSLSELSTVIESDDVVASSEDRVIDAVLHWVTHFSVKDSEDTEELENNQSENDNSETKGEDSGNDGTEDGLRDSDTDSTKEAPKDRDVVGNAPDGHALDNPSSHLCNQWTQTTATLGTNQEQYRTIQRERVKHLVPLLAKTRLCLVSSDCLQMLLEHPMIMDCMDAKDLVIKAVCYKLQTGQRHGQWPEAARHRRMSDFHNVMVYAATGLCSFVDGKNYKLKDTSPQEWDLTASCITAYDNELYKVEEGSLYVYEQSVWTQLIDLINDPNIALSHETFIYFFNANSECVSRLNPKIKPLELEKMTDFPCGNQISAATSFAKKILVFSSDDENAEQTAVHCFYPYSKTWQQLDNIEGPAKNLISFHDDKNTYVLQTTGQLWKVTNGETRSLKLKFCAKVWDFNVDLCGAVFDKDVLYVFCAPGGNKKGLPCTFSGITKQVKYKTFNRVVETTPLIMSKKFFLPWD